MRVVTEESTWRHLVTFSKEPSILFSDFVPVWHPTVPYSLQDAFHTLKKAFLKSGEHSNGYGFCLQGPGSIHATYRQYQAVTSKHYRLSHV